MVREEGEPPQRCKLLKTWKENNGSTAFQVQAVDSGELMTIIQSGPAPAEPGTHKPLASRIFHWTGNQPPPQAPVPPPTAIVLGAPLGQSGSFSAATPPTPAPTAPPAWTSAQFATMPHKPEPATPTARKPEPAPVATIPPSIPPQPTAPTAKASARPGKSSATSVLLPIDERRDSRPIPLLSRALPFVQSSDRLPPLGRPDVPSLLEPPPIVGLKPRPLPAADSTLDVVIGQRRVLVFPEVPQRVVLVVDDKDTVASLREVPHRPREWSLLGKKPGIAFLDVWLPDLSSATLYRTLHYLVRVQAADEEKKPPEKVAEKAPRDAPDLRPPEKVPVEASPHEGIYETLEQEINRTFPGSSVRLQHVADTLVVSGHARNVFEATRILSIARAYAPGAKENPCSFADSSGTGSPSLQAVLDNYAQVGGPGVVNLLRIPGEQQIMLRVVVAEVNRAAARTLGLDFGLGERPATILDGRNRAGDGSTTLVGNGWIGQTLRTMQDRHYAQTLAEPTLTTLNGQAARFRAGGEFPVPVVSPSPLGAVQGVAFRSYGVRLSIQPVVADTDRIRLAVDAEVSGTDPSATAQVAGTAVPGLKVRNFQSTVELREGETLAVAGLLRGATEPVAPPAQPGAPRPVSAEIGASGQELVVLISPLLLRPHEASARTVSRGSGFSGTDVELYLRSRNVVVPRGDARFLIGPQGYAGEAQRSSAAGR
jgi:pilus assembly protein CpaC